MNVNKQIGTQTIQFESQPRIISSASIVGPKEGKGLLSNYFDKILEDVLWGEESWESAESKIVKEVIKLAIKKANLNIDDIRYIFAGDLLSQLIASTFGVKELEKPFFGLYGACSTMGQSLLLASMCIDGGFANYCVASTSSHFCGAEKQFRYPLEYGSQRTPTTSWTVTGGGAFVLAKEGEGPRITYGLPGKIVDLGVKDAMNMGAAMAPSAADTLITFFKDTGKTPNDFDIIVTGDLGVVGKELLIQLLKKEGYDIGDNYIDCGVEIFDSTTQNTCAGGSGCACSAVTLAGYLMDQLKQKKVNSIVFLPTGALFNNISTNEGESIPGITQGVVIEN